MSNNLSNDEESRKTDIELDLTSEDVTDVRRDAATYLPLDVISKRARMALEAIIFSSKVRSMARIEITEIGVVPDVPPDNRFKEIPEDIPKGALFVCGKMLAPIPMCKTNIKNPEDEKKDEDGKKDKDLGWKLLHLDFSYYRTGPGNKPKIIISVFPYKRSSDFLKPENERIAERQKGFERLRRGTYGRKIPNETFHGLKEEFEPIFERWIIEHVQRMIDEGDLKDIAGAVENEKSLFSGADLQIDATATTAVMDADLKKELQMAAPVHISSSQCYVGEQAQSGWLRLCNAPSYDLTGREQEFLSKHARKIAEEAGQVDHAIIFGVGDAKKETLFIKELLEGNQNREMRVHGIDVGSKFHLHALEGMKTIRTETEKNIKYRGYVALFEKAFEITDGIRMRSTGNPKFLRVSFGNTFGNFDDAWSVFTKGMRKGDVLVITSDIVPSRQDPARESRINEIVARYRIHQWKEWVLNPLYRAGFLRLVSPDNVEVTWNEARSAIEFTYKFTEGVDYGAGKFGAGDQIRLYLSRKIEIEQFEREATRSGFVIKSNIQNDAGDFGCFVLEKQ
ncbi:L-histidine N(alpha)-methyltransferase [Patescibacteria group bacterium]|nr:L-histidine N(alpha)-methyltransferase [Patescibacteria group bacterium]MBU1703552.1 L-histidine N(alpha)-methyltransferase [Patescibacteria group bacterium]MBU1954277.1 L-histidine N(alpha)-methyltransferase [Patescibacteria group bacterium]